MQSFSSFKSFKSFSTDGATFFDPPWEEAAGLVADNIRRRQSYGLEIGGLPFVRLAAEARAELCRLAADYTQQYRHVGATASSTAPLILAGHQPKLFHPGVLFKGFVLHSLAKRVAGVAINLIVDNDLAGAPAIRVPTGSVAEPRVESVAFDVRTADIPFEERGLIDRQVFDSFGERVRQLMQPLGLNPLVHGWWPRAIDAAHRDRNLGQCIAAARHQLESEWGLNTLELPLSTVCETRSFRRFVLHLFQELPSLCQIYNDCLLEYRRVNRIRSRSHPVPELEQFADGWLEAPLWIWTHDDPRRRRLFVRQHGTHWELTGRSENRWHLPVFTVEDGDDSLEAFARMAEGGVKIRPRALITTMYARLVLGDLFIHGIGGGEYDQLTDAIVRRWLGIDPPNYLVATATARLPIARPGSSGDDLREVERHLRDLNFNPDRYLAGRVEAAVLVAEKRAWIANKPVLGLDRARHEAIVRVNNLLQPFVAELRSSLLARRDQIAELLRRDRLLGSREFAFCLFPEETLRALLLDNG